MYGKVLHFIKYNNAFTIFLVLFFFGFGISFAADPAILDPVYSSRESVISVDNSRIISVDLDNYNFNLRINAITEDEKNYYATYSYQTMEIVNGVWQDKQAEKVLTINKEALEGKDLGLYVAKQLGENINYELSYLKRVQKLEKEKGDSQKVITTEYSGLIGKLLDPKQEVIEGYTPVIPEPAPEVPVAVEEHPEMIVVSTEYPDQQAEQAAPPAEQSPETKLQTEPKSEEETLSTDPIPLENREEEKLAPLPEEMINEELVQEVVSVLLENQETSTSTPSKDSTPMNSLEQEIPSQTNEVPAPATESSTTPESIPAQ
jgi:hypothetical protein